MSDQKARHSFRLPGGSYSWAMTSILNDSWECRVGSDCLADDIVIQLYVTRGDECERFHKGYVYVYEPGKPHFLCLYRDEMFESWEAATDALQDWWDTSGENALETLAAFGGLLGRLGSTMRSQSHTERYGVQELVSVGDQDL